MLAGRLSVWHSSRVAAAHLQTLVPAAASDFQVSLLVFGCLLIGGALLSGIAHRSALSLTALFVLAGFVLGEGGLDVVHFDAHSEFVGDLATVALIVILFRDGLEVEGEMLQSHWHLPFRKLALAMPLTAVIVALATKLLAGLTWTESFLVGRVAVADRSGAVHERGHQPPGAADHPTLAEPRVGAQRRPRAAGRARFRRGAAGRQRRVRVVAVPAART